MALNAVFTPTLSMQGQDATAKAIQEDIDDQYRLLRRDVQHGRADLVSYHKSSSDTWMSPSTSMAFPTTWCFLQVRETILDCALELSPKTPMYATLVGKPET